jgi:hypothetical protein
MTTPAPQGIRTETDGEVLIVTIDRPPARNAVDRPTADALYETFKSFDADDTLSVAILTGANGNFCAGADLKAVAEGRGNKSVPDGDYGPMGPSRLELSKPVIAAVDGYAVAGGLELACWCDLRVASPGAKFGVFCRRFGVPLIDGGTIRLPRLIGTSRAMDMILTGREVGAEEALAFGLGQLCIGGRLRPSKSAGGRPKDRCVPTSLHADGPRLCRGAMVPSNGRGVTPGDRRRPARHRDGRNPGWCQTFRRRHRPRRRLLRGKAHRGVPSGGGPATA